MRSEFKISNPSFKSCYVKTFWWRYLMVQIAVYGSVVCGMFLVQKWSVWIASGGMSRLSVIMCVWLCILWEFEGVCPCVCMCVYVRVFPNDFTMLMPQGTEIHFLSLSSYFDSDAPRCSYSSNCTKTNHTHTYTHTHTHTLTHSFSHTLTHIFKLDSYTYTYTHAPTQTYTHIHTYSHTPTDCHTPSHC